MITISKAKMKELLLNYMELGLTNVEIAKRLNAEHGATDRNALTAVGVAKLKNLVGLKGYKPKKKQLFELVDEVETPKAPAPEFEDLERLQEEFIAEDEAIAMTEADYFDGDESDRINY